MKIKNRLALLLIPLGIVLAATQGAAFYFLASTPEASSFYPDRLLDISAGIAGSTFICIVIALIIVSNVLENQFSKKLARLKNDIEKIGQGKFSEVTSEKSGKKDEIGALENSIHSMRQSIEINQKSMQKLAYFDKLTGLPNRASLQQELKMLISDAKRNNEYFGVIYLDLDDFKIINDTLGHDIGDELLKAVSARIQKLLRGSDYVVRENMEDPESGNSMLARLAGDEFTLLIHDIQNPSTVANVAKRLLDSLSRPFVLSQHEVQVGASMGISIYPQDGEDPESLLKKADYAMFEAKKHHKNSFEFYTKEMNAVAFQRMAMESKVRKALDNQEFLLLFHPRVNLNEKSISGFEALIRWQNPELGLVMPNQFIPLAEETLLICEIGYWVFDNVCQHIQHWVENGYPDIRVSINISSMQIYRGDTYNMLKTLLSLYKISGSNLEIEVTEAGLLKEEKASMELLEKLKELDITIALDEFGTDNTSIRILQDFPIDVLKIDRSLVLKGEQDPATKQLLKSFVEIANNFNLETVASGIEHERQVTYARTIKCDYIQGYYYSEPLAGEDALDFLESWEQTQINSNI